MEMIEKMIMDPRTTLDLKRLEEIRIARSKLYDEKRLIKDNCPCHDSVAIIEETFKFEVTPIRVCPVCGQLKDELSLEEKIICLREYYTFDEEVPNEEAIAKIAEAGGCNHFDTSIYAKGSD